MTPPGFPTWNGDRVRDQSPNRQRSKEGALLVIRRGDERPMVVKQEIDAVRELLTKK